MASTNKEKTLIALVPVIHTRYLDLFKKYSDTLYILGESILDGWEKQVNLHRDLRRIDQEMIADFIQKSGLVSNVKVLEKDDLPELEGKEIVMPQEDVSEWFAENYLQSNAVEFEDIFLRWNRPVSTQELVDPEDRKISSEDFHKEMISKAVEVSDKAVNWWRQVGILVVKDGKIIAEGFNRTVPTQQNKDVYGDLRMCFDAGESHELCAEIHAEASVIALAARKGFSLEGSDVFVTVFPCPTCAKLLAEAGIKTVYYKEGYSLSDANDVLNGAGVEIIKVTD